MAFDENTTPHRALNTELVCSIVNASQLIKSPSKVPGKEPTNWFDSGIVTADGSTIQSNYERQEEINCRQQPCQRWY